MTTIIPSRAEDFVSSIGVNTHLNYGDKVYGTGFESIILPRLRELGVRHLRDKAEYLDDPVWMDGLYRRWREVAEATGVKFTAMVHPRRTHAGTGTDFDDMSHVLELAARILPDNIAGLEGVNELDLADPPHPDWAFKARQAQRALYAAAAGLGIPVLGPTVGRIEHAAELGDLSDYMDMGNIHPYDGGQAPGTNLARHMREATRMSARLPLQATEVGYHTAPTSSVPGHGPVSELAQAKYTLRQFFENWNAGIQRSFAYELIDQGTDPSQMEENFGLLRNDGSPKPAFTGLRNLIALLGERGATHFRPEPLAHGLSLPEGVSHAYFQKSDGRCYLALWQTTASYDALTGRDVLVAPIRVGLGSDVAPQRVTTYAPLLGAFPQSVAHRLSLSVVCVPDHPIILEIVP